MTYPKRFELLPPRFCSLSIAAVLAVRTVANIFRPRDTQAIPSLRDSSNLKFNISLILLAGAPGFEPGNGGIKIRCLTTWLRPTSAARRRAWRLPAAPCSAAASHRPRGSRNRSAAAAGTIRGPPATINACPAGSIGAGPASGWTACGRTAPESSPGAAKPCSCRMFVGQFSRARSAPKPAAPSHADQCRPVTPQTCGGGEIPARRV